MYGFLYECKFLTIEETNKKKKKKKHLLPIFLLHVLINKTSDISRVGMAYRSRSLGFTTAVF